MRVRHVVCVLFTQLYPTLCNPMDCSSPGSSVHGILQVSIVQWVSSPLSRGSSQPRIEPRSPELHAGYLQSKSPGKPMYIYIHTHFPPSLTTDIQV